MYTLVRRYIKTAIVFLAVGLAIGLWLVVARELFRHYPEPYLVSAHTHAILVGFVMMMILGVALWLFPRPDREDTQYRPGVAEGAYWLLTAGTAVRIGGEILRVAVTLAVVRWLVVLASTAQLMGILLFFWTMWSRIRPVGSRAREQKGERF